MARDVMQIFDDIEAVELTYIPREPRRVTDPSNGKTFGWTQWRPPQQSLAATYDEFRRSAIRNLARPEHVAAVADYISGDRDARLSLRAKHAAD